MVVTSTSPCLHLSPHQPLSLKHIKIATHLVSISQITIRQVNAFIGSLPMNLVRLGEFRWSRERELLICVGGGTCVNLQFSACGGGAAGDIQTFVTVDYEPTT